MIMKKNHGKEGLIELAQRTAEHGVSFKTLCLMVLIMKQILNHY